MATIIITPEKTAINSGISQVVSLVKNNHNNNQIVLDYGCGKGRNLIALADTFLIDAIDTPLQISMTSETIKPYARTIYSTNDLIKYQYDIIVCTFVLNVIPNHSDRLKILNTIRSLLKDTGTAYIQVRTENDLKSTKNKELFNDGYLIKKGNDYTFQIGFTIEILREYMSNSSLNIIKLIKNSNNLIAIVNKE